MAKTIIQSIGPLYGEVVNGTVFGRPNGSIYVPPFNTVKLNLAETYRFIVAYSDTVYRTCNSEGNPAYAYFYYVAEAQDLATYIQAQVYTDEACTQLVASRSYSAGAFNGSGRDLNKADSIEDGATYYLRVQLMNNDSPVATSEVIPIVGVVPE